ncbi:hypothetical protein [Caballeronia grimmiae]|uniref:hypothetical protein n=1 Tax=Caballeronia grimmiae TaxID=1071679 RepID=UPI0038BA01B5
MKDISTTLPVGKSPYTPYTIDGAIAHLERILYADGADSIFARTYWRGRVLQAHATPGLVPPQRERLERLLDRTTGELNG